MRRPFLAVTFFCVLSMTGLALAASPGGSRSTAVVKALNDYEARQAKAVRQISAAPAVRQKNAAAPETANRAIAKDMAKKLFSFEMGIESYYYKYTETVEGNHFMDLKGTYRGIFAKIIWPLQVNGNEFWDKYPSRVTFDTRFAWGDVHYNSALSDGMGFVAPLHITDIPDIVSETRLTATKDIPWQGLAVSPFGGIGFRYLVDDTSDKSVIIDYYGTPVNVVGYKRKSYYYYLPLGIDVAKDLANRWKIGMNAEYDYLIYGTQKSYIALSNGRVPSNTQTKGYGLRAALRLARDFSKCGLTVEPFIRFWDIENSNVVFGALMEPSNTTREIGMKMGLTF